MRSLHLTRYVVLRISQRAIGVDDIELVEFIGTEVEGGYLVRRRDVQALRELKQLWHRARRLQGKRVVVANDALVTAYHARQSKQRQLLRSADDRSLSAN
jgi:hypothetical protein